MYLKATAELTQLRGVCQGATIAKAFPKLASLGSDSNPTRSSRTSV